MSSVPPIMATAGEAETSACERFAEGCCWDASCRRQHHSQPWTIECRYSRLFSSRREFCWRSDCRFRHKREAVDPDLPTAAPVPAMRRGRASSDDAEGARRIAWQQQALALERHGLKAARKTVAQRRAFLHHHVGQTRRAARRGIVLTRPIRRSAMTLAAARRLARVATNIVDAQETAMTRVLEQWPDVPESDVEGTLDSPVWESDGPGSSDDTSLGPDSETE